MLFERDRHEANNAESWYNSLCLWITDPLPYPPIWETNLTSVLPSTCGLSLVNTPSPTGLTQSLEHVTELRAWPFGISS